MFNQTGLRLTISETLKQIGLYSSDAVELLMGTCAQESAFGKYRRQLGNGPALGVFQMEPATFNDIVKNYLHYKQPLFLRILEVSSLSSYDSQELINNDVFAICMARVHYLRVPKPIPNTVDGWAAYWKQYYNTYLGKGKIEEYTKNYIKHCM